MMTLRELVDRYRALAGGCSPPLDASLGCAVALSAFGLSAAETERLFSAYDEDYHISRYFHFSEADGEKFSINGMLATHVVLDAEITTIL